MAIFNSYVSHYQRVTSFMWGWSRQPPLWSTNSGLGQRNVPDPWARLACLKFPVGQEPSDDRPSDSRGSSGSISSTSRQSLCVNDRLTSCQNRPSRVQCSNLRPKLGWNSAGSVESLGRWFRWETSGYAQHFANWKPWPIKMMISMMTYL